ncbi:hypothetical protein [Archaeoglobus sp.]
MYANESKEEWIWRGLAIAMCLAMVGLAVMPVLNQSNLYGEYMLHKNMRENISPIGEAAAAGVAVMDGFIWTCLLISVASTGAIGALVILGIGAALW